MQAERSVGEGDNIWYFGNCKCAISNELWIISKKGSVQLGGPSVCLDQKPTGKMVTDLCIEHIAFQQLVKTTVWEPYDLVICSKVIIYLRSRADDDSTRD